MPLLFYQEEALEVIRREKIRQEEQALTATDDIFRGMYAKPIDLVLLRLFDDRQDLKSI